MATGTVGSEQSAAAGNADSEASESAFQENTATAQLEHSAEAANGSGVDSAHRTKVAGQATSANWAKAASVTPPPNVKQRMTVATRKRDLLNLQSSLSPKYIGFGSANSPTFSDSDEAIRTMRRRNPPHNTTLSSSCENAITKTPTSQLISNSRNFLSPIERLLIKNGASSPNSTGFEGDAEDIAVPPKRKIIKRKQKRGRKPKKVAQEHQNKTQEHEQGMEISESKLSMKAESPVEPIQTFQKQSEPPDTVNSNSEIDSVVLKESLPAHESKMESIENSMKTSDSKKVSADHIPNVNQEKQKPTADAIDSPPTIKASSDQDKSLKSPSTDSIDSAKGSSIATDVAWPIYQIGDLYWGRLYTFCFWPCMVCPDPAGNYLDSPLIQVLRNSNNATVTADLQIQVHVRFFADNGRRNWVKHENLVPFAGLKAYEDWREKVRIEHGVKSIKFRQMVPKKAKLNVWHRAIDEAVQVSEASYIDRLEKFYQIYESAIVHRKKRKRTSSMMQDTICPTSDVGSSLYDSTDNLNAKSDNHTIVKHERSMTPYSPAFSPVKNNSQLFKAKRRKMSNSTARIESNSNSIDTTLSDTSLHQNPEFTDLFDAIKEYVMVRSVDTKVEKCLLAVVRNIWSLKQLQVRELERELTLTEAIDNDNQHLGSAVVERGAGTMKRLSNRLRTIMIRRSITPVISSVANSTPPPTQKERYLSEQPRGKKITNRSIEEVIEDIMNWDRKALFKGLGRDPVCKYCYKPDPDLIACTKKCGSWLHVDCLNESKPKAVGKTTKKITLKNAMVKEVKKSPSPNNETSSTSVSPITNAEQTDIASEAVDTEMNTGSPIICRECVINAPEPCCICMQVNVTLSTPPSSPLKAIDEKPSTSAAAASMRDPHQLVACNQQMCTKKFHSICCKYWPQAKITKSTSRCPKHVCHTCVSDDPRGKYQQLPNTKLIKCVKCPATYHVDSRCIPAGSQILTAAHMICPRHNVHNGDACVNVTWCYICVKGGELVCCETCPIAVHTGCRNIPIKANESYICEECESGRLPLYGEIVWAKFNYFRWWPAIILPPTEIPSNIFKIPHGPSEFVVRFFGTNDHGWISRRRVYLYIEGDTGESFKSKSQLFKNYMAGVDEASRFLKIIKAKRQEQLHGNMSASKLHPQPYVKIKTNKPVPPVRFIYNGEDVSVCECKPDFEHPCSSDSGCLNRLLYHECNPNYCRARDRCENQMFEKRKSPRVEVAYMKQRGFGLVARESISAGDFVIEYVGEVINHAEFRQRLEQKARDRDENYYFLGVEKDFIIDAGPKGNLARFMNHSCQPNCETQKWNVNSIHRVGLFAINDIPANTELTFNYLWDDLMNHGKKACYCGAPNCSGTIGGKPIKKDETSKETEQDTTKKARTKIKTLKRLQRKKAHFRIHMAFDKKQNPNAKAKHISADDDDPSLTDDQKL